MTPRKLLIAVVNSDASVHAFQWAMKELYRRGDEVHLCHVIDSAQVPPALFGVPAVEFAMPTPEVKPSQEVIAGARKFIVEMFLTKANLPECGQLDPMPVVHIVRAELDTASVGQALCNKANELDVACMVMATHTKGKLAQIFLGSVTKYCLHHSNKTVAVVRHC